MVGVEGRELVVSDRRPFRAQPPKSLHPPFAILALETGRVPDQEDPVARKQRTNAPHEVLLRISAQMLKRLANPDDVNRLVPVRNRLDEILAAKVDGTAQTAKIALGDVKGRLRNIDADNWMLVISSAVGLIEVNDHGESDCRYVITRDKYDAVLLDLDGVVTDTANLHAACWKQMFDEYLLKRATMPGEALRLFDLDTDYRVYIDGKPRFDGVRTFSPHVRYAFPREARRTRHKRNSCAASETARTSWSPR